MKDLELASTADRAATEDAYSTDDFGRASTLPPADLSSLIIGSYRIEGLLGEGGMGRVYLARQENPARKVALKVMAPGRLSERAMRRFEYEAEILGRLQHPGIAQVYEAGTSKGSEGALQPFFAMEYIEGSTLLKFMREGTLDLPRKLALLAEIADAVEHAHRRGVVHRDLKPGNIVVDREGRPKVLDFGVARIADANRDATEVGSIVGTLAYMSPEQAGGDPAAVDTRTDVYSLGVVMYQALAGVLPIDLTGKTTLEAIRTIAESKVVPLDLRDTSIPSDAAAIAAKAIATDKEQRYSSAAEFAADLRRFLANEPIQARTPSTWYSLKKYIQRKRAQAAAIFLGTFAVLAALVVASISYVQVQSADAEKRFQVRLTGMESAKAQMAAARRLMQRGDWRNALQTLKAIDVAHVDDPVERDLEIARSLVALNRRSEAKSLLDAAGSSTGGREAEALLLRADFEMAESGSGPAAEEMLRKALSLRTLDPADAAYAEGLLADKTTVAIARFRATLELDPYHHGARGALVLLLSLVGEHADAVRLGETGRTLYPDDPNFVFSLAAIAALNGDRAKSRRVLEAARSQFGAETIADLSAVVELIADAESALANIVRGAAATEIAPTVLRFGALAQRMNGRPDSALSASIPSLPCLRKSFGWVGGRVLRMISPIPLGAKEEAKLAEEIAVAMADHPDGILIAFTAMLQMPPDARSTPEAYRKTDAVARQLERAVRMKTFVPNALRSCKIAALTTLSELSLIAREGKAPPGLDLADQRRRLRELAEYCVASESYHPDIWNVAALAAALGEDHRLSRRIAEEWTQRDPQNAMAKIRVIAAEVKLGNSSGALRMLDQLEPKLKNSPLAVHAKRFRAEATADFRSLAAKLK
jgi:predicted Ser/Thr protein kinase